MGNGENRELAFKAVQDIFTCNNCICLILSEVEGFRPVLNIEFDKGSLHVSSILEKPDIENGSCFTNADIADDIITLVDHASEFRVEVVKEPFEFCVKDNTGHAIIRSFSGPDGFVFMNIDANGSAKGFKLHLKTNNRFFYGFGERFDQVDQSGKKPYMDVIEQFGVQNEKTYIPVPFFITEKNYGIYVNTALHTQFSLPAKGHDLLVIETDVNDSSPLTDMHIFFGEPKKLIKSYIEMTGYPKLPPKWSFGPWMSSNGWNTQKEVLEQVDMMKKLDIPASVIVIEAWSDEATFYIFNDAKYSLKNGKESFEYNDFEFEADGRWPDPKDMIDTIHENNLKLVLWQIPVIKHFGKVEVHQHFQDEKHVIDKKFCVLNDDGTPYRIPDNWFCKSLVFDFTNPEARKWWFDKRRYLIEDLGVDGFKTDGGEFIYYPEVCFHNGRKGHEMKNLYPVEYIGAYYDFIGENRITFSRAGYTGAQRFPLFWAGDQLSTFDALRSHLTAGLSLSISGNPFWGFDIGGFAGEMPTSELYIRSAQMAAFCPVMQFHSTNREGFNNDRSPWNVSRYTGDEKVIDIYRKYANIRMNIMPYIYNEAKYIAETGEPFMRHLIVDFPGDEAAYGIEDQYLFGRSLLIAPVIQEGAVQRSIYLPDGEWIDFWDGKNYKGLCRMDYCYDIDRIPVFIRNGSVLPLNLNEGFEIGGHIGNEIDKYSNLCFMITGRISEEYTFYDNLGNRVIISTSSQGLNVEASGDLDEVYVLSQDADMLAGGNASVRLNNADYYIQVFRCGEL